jgi:hypothetical protein
VEVLVLVEMGVMVVQEIQEEQVQLVVRVAMVL